MKAAITIITTIIMTPPETDPTTLVRLMTWLSPAFPTGAFAYSHGLEAAFHREVVSTRDELEGWLAALIRQGSGWNDAVLCAEAWRRADLDGDLAELARMGEAMAGSAERHLETMAQGAAFLAAAREWQGAVPKVLIGDCPLPVALGAVAGRMRIALRAMLAAYLNAFVGNLVQAAQRLGRIGQQDGVAMIAGLEPAVLETAARAETSSLGDLGSATVASDLMALAHETQGTRIFRS